MKMRMTPLLFALGVCGAHAVLWAQTNQRLSDWLKQSNVSQESYLLGLQWHTPPAVF